jgi:hypothetical protein
MGSAIGCPDDPEEGPHVIRHVLLDRIESLHDGMHLIGVVRAQSAPRKARIGVPVATELRLGDIPAIETQESSLNTAGSLSGTEQAN